MSHLCIRAVCLALLLFTVARLGAQTHTDSQGVKYDLNTAYRTATVVMQGSSADRLTLPSEPYTAISGEIVIPESITVGGVDYVVTTVAYGAFAQCTALTSVTLPKSINQCIIGPSLVNRSYIWNPVSISYSLEAENTGTAMFAYCTALERVRIDCSLEAMGDDPFYGCAALREVDLNGSHITGEGLLAMFGNSLTDLGNWMTTPNSYAVELVGLTDIKLPTSVEFIPRFTFASLPALERLSGIESVRHIGDLAFADCSKLTTIAPTEESFSEGEWIFPEGLVEIGSFVGGPGMKRVNLPSTLERIGQGGFYSLSREVFANLSSSFGKSYSIVLQGSPLLDGCHIDAMDAPELEILPIPELTTLSEGGIILRAPDVFDLKHGLTNINIRVDSPFGTADEKPILVVPEGSAEGYAAMALWSDSFDLMEPRPTLEFDVEPDAGDVVIRIEYPESGGKIVVDAGTGEMIAVSGSGTTEVISSDHGSHIRIFATKGLASGETVMQIRGIGVTDILLDNNENVNTVDLSNNSLTDLDLTENGNIHAVNVSANSLSSIALHADVAYSMIDISENRFTFATLPVVDCAVRFSYSNQADVEPTVENRCVVDLSSYVIDGTEVRWFDGDREITVTPMGDIMPMAETQAPYTADGYRFTFHEQYSNLRAEMTNDRYPDLTLSTVTLTVDPSTPTGIETVTAIPADAAFYTLTGVRIASPAEGQTVICVDAQGTARMILVR